VVELNSAILRFLFHKCHLQGDDDLVIVHDALGFGGCHLAVAVGRLSFPSLSLVVREQDKQVKHHYCMRMS
jgi:hypothetical protein